MVAESQRPRWSVAAFVEMERASPIRHEYIDGYVYATAGGTRRHSRVSVNLTAALRDVLRGNPCQVFNSDMMVRIDEHNYVYPDASISCDPRDTADDEPAFITYPFVIGEVLSDESTARYDRGDKFRLLYTRIDALREYVLVDTRTIAIEVFHRAEGDWTLDAYGRDDEIALSSVGATLRVAGLYEGIAI